MVEAEVEAEAELEARCFSARAGSVFHTASAQGADSPNTALQLESGADWRD